MNRLASMSKLVVLFVVLASWSLVKSGIMLIEGQSWEYQVNYTNANDLYQEFGLGIQSYDAALWVMEPGDLIFVDYQGDGVADHVGIIYRGVIHATNARYLDPYHDTLNNPYGHSVAWERLDYRNYWSRYFLDLGRPPAEKQLFTVTYFYKDRNDSDSRDVSDSNPKIVKLPHLHSIKTKPHTVLTCKYGIKPGEIMPYEVPEGMDGLPHFGGFGVDTGNLIILTDYANRMQIFNTDGKLIRVIDEFKNSDEYLTIARRVSILKGRCPLYRFNDVGRKVPPINIVVTANDGTLHINIYKVKRIDKRWKETDELVSTIIFTVDNTLEKYYPRCIGMDTDFNFYIYYAIKPEITYREGRFIKCSYYVAKFSLQGDFLGCVKVENCQYYPDFHGPVVSETGDIYVCNTDKDSLWIVRYPAKMFDESIGKYE